jgi:hypothetical protein
MRVLPVCMSALLFLSPISLGQEATDEDPKPANAEVTTDWSAFDAVAAVKAANEPPPDTRFERLWTSQHRVRLLQGLAISTDGKRVLALTTDGRCQVYDADTSKVVATVSESLGGVTHAALSPNGSHGAVGLLSREVVVFDAANGKVLHRHPPTDDARAARTNRLSLSALRFTADGQHVAWLIENGRLERVAVASGERSAHKFDIDLRPEKMHIAAISGDGLVAACDPSVQKAMFAYLVLPQPGSTDQPEILERKFVQAPVIWVLSQNLIAYQTGYGNLVVQSHLHKRLPPGKRISSTSVSRLTASRTGMGPLDISTDEKWLLAVGRGQVEVRRLDVPFLASLHLADVADAAQIAVSVDAWRIAIVDHDGRLAVLQLAQPPELPVWRFQNTLIALLKDKQFEHVDAISDLLQDDPEPFSFDLENPKHHTFVEQMVRVDAWERSGTSAAAGMLDQWLMQRPDSKLARLLLVRQLVNQAWEARGSGYANTVTEAGWDVFRQRITQAHAEMDKLLAQDRPPPESFMWLFDIAKAEGWSEDECMEQAQRIAELSPRYLMPHLCMVEKQLMRWGGEPHSSAMYAAWASDKVDGAEGDALYAQLVARIAAYEQPPVLTEALSIDWERVYKGCEALQAMPDRRPLGVLMELNFANLLGDEARLQHAAHIIDQERTPFVPGVRLTRAGFDKLYREYVDRVPQPKKESSSEDL